MTNMMKVMLNASVSVWVGIFFENVFIDFFGFLCFDEDLFDTVPVLNIKKFVPLDFSSFFDSIMVKNVMRMTINDSFHQSKSHSINVFFLFFRTILVIRMFCLVCFRLEFEYVAKGFIFRKGRIKVSSSSHSGINFSLMSHSHSCKVHVL
jgi:hypothetical protein